MLSMLAMFQLEEKCLVASLFHIASLDLGNKSLTKEFFWTCSVTWRETCHCSKSLLFFLESCPLKGAGIFDKVSMSYFFPSQDIKRNVLRFYSDSWWRHKRFIFNHPLKQWSTGKKRERRKYKNLNISWTKRAFSYEIKVMFIII